MPRGVGGGGAIGRGGSVQPTIETKTTAETPKPSKTSMESIETTPGQKQAAKAHAHGKIADHSMHGSAVQKGLSDKLSPAESQANVSKHDAKYAEVQTRRQEFGEARKKLNEAKGETRKARADLKSLDTMGSQLDQLKAKRDDAKSKLESSQQQRPGESDLQWQTRKLEQESMKRFTGKTGEQTDYDSAKKAYDDAKAKAYAGKAPLKEKVAELKEKEAGARKEYLRSGNELKSALEAYRPSEKKQAHARAKAEHAQADELRRKGTRLGHEAPDAERVFVLQHREYQKKDSKGKKETVRIQQQAKEVYMPRAEAKKAERAHALEESARLSAQASKLDENALRLQRSHGVKEELKDLKKELKKER